MATWTMSSVVWYSSWKIETRRRPRTCARWASAWSLLDFGRADCSYTELQAALVPRAAGGKETSRPAIPLTVHRLTRYQHLVTSSSGLRPGGRRLEPLFGQPPVDASCRYTIPPRLSSRRAVGGAEPSWFVRHELGTGQEFGTSAITVALKTLLGADSLPRSALAQQPRPPSWRARPMIFSNPVPSRNVDGRARASRSDGRRMTLPLNWPPEDASGRCTKPPMLPSRGAVGVADPSWFVRLVEGADGELCELIAMAARQAACLSVRRLAAVPEDAGGRCGVPPRPPSLAAVGST